MTHPVFEIKILNWTGTWTQNEFHTSNKRVVISRLFRCILRLGYWLINFVDSLDKIYPLICRPICENTQDNQLTLGIPTFNLTLGKVSLPH